MELVNKILAKKRVQITPMRQLLLEYFLQHRKTLSLAELEKTFSESYRVTMHQTLQVFEEKGIIHSVSIGANKIKYGLCKEHYTPFHRLDLHPHFYCSNCKQITCWENTFIPSIELPNGYSANEISITIKGICKNCQEVESSLKKV